MAQKLKHMEKRKKLTLLWRKLNSLEFGKDVVLVPYYLGQALGYQTEICCGYSEEVAKLIPTIPQKELVFTKEPLSHNPYQRIFVYIKYLLQNASHIDLLICFHWKLETFVNILLYKLLNKHGQVYIKLDTGSGEEWNLSKRSFLSKALRKKLYTNCLNKIDVLSCETSQAYNYLCQNSDFGNLMARKLVWMPNAFDEEQFAASGISERTYQQKENLIITVGRLGTHQKNTGFILNALKRIELKGWKFVLIGPIEEEFNETIEQFFQTYPEKKEQVIFTGKIDGKKELWEWYNKAKVFVCTSRWESYGIVLNEAKRFRNYIVSTHVGGADDLIGQERYGSFIKQEDDTDLRLLLTQIVNGEINTDVFQDYDVRQLSYQRGISVLLKYLFIPKE